MPYSLKFKHEGCIYFIVFNIIFLVQEIHMGKTLTSRLPDEIAEKIEEIAKIEKLDKSSIIRRLLDKGIV